MRIARAAPQALEATPAATPSESLGPAPRAFLVITLAASLFADAANAIGIGTMFHLLN